MAKADDEARRHDPAEVIGVASELAAEKGPGASRAELAEIGAELGVTPREIDRALVEIDRRRSVRAARFRTALIAGALLVPTGVVVHLLTRGPGPPAASTAAAGSPSSAVPAAPSSVVPAAPPPPVSATEPRPFVEPPPDPTALAGIRVGIDTRRGVAPTDAATTLATRGAAVRSVETAPTTELLQAHDVVVLNGASKSAYEPAELEALEGFVRAGGGLVVADLGWWWTTYPKKPIAELPANVLGQRLGYQLTSDVGGSPRSLDADVLGPISSLRQDGWVPCVIAVTGERARVVVHDENRRPLVATVAPGRGRVVVFGHMGMLDQNPTLFAWAVKHASGRP